MLPFLSVHGYEFHVAMHRSLPCANSLYTLFKTHIPKDWTDRQTRLSRISLTFIFDSLFPGGGWGLQKEVLQQMLHSKLVGLSPEKEAQEAAPASPRSSKEKRVRHHTSIDPREVQTATVRALSKSSSSRRARSRSDVDMRDVRLYNASITFPLLLNIYIYIFLLRRVSGSRMRCSTYAPTPTQRWRCCHCVDLVVRFFLSFLCRSLF